MTNTYLEEASRKTPVCTECDLCIIGGSCTGVFAAIRAARMGLKVVIVEQDTILGGMATAAQVNEWHSTWDTTGEQRIIGGLTLEVVDRLRKRNAIAEQRPIHRGEFRFNSAELAGELDVLAREHGIRLFLAARCVAATYDSGSITAAIIEDRSGRRAIRARYFIDASGDGTLLQAASFPVTKPVSLQPVNLQAIVAGVSDLDVKSIWKTIQPHLQDHDYPASNSVPWHFNYPGADDVLNLFGARQNGLDAADADDYTTALIEGRRLHRTYIDMIRQYLPSDTNIPSIISWSHALGVRQTRHANCLYRITGEDLLSGDVFDDAIAQGTYPIDIHSPEGTILRYLDGREEKVLKSGEIVHGHWKNNKDAITRFYTIPYRSLIPKGATNLLIAGRLIDADRNAFGAARVMVNLNQTGEAAGTAAALALSANCSVDKVSADALRTTLNKQGSLLIS